MSWNDKAQTWNTFRYQRMENLKFGMKTYHGCVWTAEYMQVYSGGQFLQIEWGDNQWDLNHAVRFDQTLQQQQQQHTIIEVIVKRYWME